MRPRRSKPKLLAALLAPLVVGLLLCAYMRARFARLRLLSTAPISKHIGNFSDEWHARPAALRALAVEVRAHPNSRLIEIRYRLIPEQAHGIVLYKGREATVTLREVCATSTYYKEELGGMTPNNVALMARQLPKVFSSWDELMDIRLGMYHNSRYVRTRGLAPLVPPPSRSPRSSIISPAYHP